MTAQPNEDEIEEGRTYADMLVEVEHNLAAVFRQYRRASEARDWAAIALETEAVASWVQRLIFLHLEVEIGTSSEDWVWPNGNESCRVELLGSELKLSGRIFCSLPHGSREWSEPFAARIVHADDRFGLEDYTLWWGARATLLNRSTVEGLVRFGQDASEQSRFELRLLGAVFSSLVPTSESGWAYVFRK